MADQLYLSLWYPNFRLQSLPDALKGVLTQFAVIAKDGKPKSELGRVAAASVYPIDWTETPIYQRIYVNDERAEESTDTQAALIENAVAEATEQLHEDSAYEFEMVWMLSLPESEGELDTVWKLRPSKVRITGFGPNFDAGSYEQNGQIRVDFGLDTPWVLEDELIGDEANEFELKVAEKHIQQNVEKLLAFTLSVEKHCGISSRLLWTESGEPLAEKLIARLQRLN
jgi:hypothetical protein